MSKSNDALTAFLTNWDNLKRDRPTERDFSPYGHPLSYESMDELFGRWKTMLRLLDDKGYWSTSPEVAISDAPLAALINDLSSITQNGRQHGVNWLLSNRFLDVSHHVQLQLSAIARKQAGLNREVAKLLEKRSTETLDEILAAAKAAKSVIALEATSAQDAKKIADATAGIEAANALSESTNSRLATLASESDAHAKSVKENQKIIEQALSVIASMKNAADTREQELAGRVEELNAQIKLTDESAKSAFKSVEDALRAARDQGLAHSFQSRSNRLQTERRVWTLIFGGSAVILAALAMVFAVELPRLDYEALAVLLLRKIGLAAPVIWLGWYSARQVGRISRVQEDYEYKAASALAFQSYKDEAKLGGDPAMEKKLLEHAITTFGENPVRLYEHHTQEPVTPLQAAIKDLPPEKVAAILAAVGEQTLKAKFWSLGK